MNTRLVRSISLASALVALVAAPPLVAAIDEHAKAVAEYEAIAAQLSGAQMRLLQVSEGDKAEHAELLARPNTGIVRLLPRERYDGYLPVRGGGAYYSFSRLTHEYGYGSDIALSNGEFSVGFAGCDWGLIGDLGDVDIANLSAESGALADVAAIRPATTEHDARRDHRMAQEGLTKSGVSFKNRAKVVLGSTYAVRSVSYRTSDLLVAFRVIREDADGSVVLVWRTLATFEQPTLTRER